MERFLGAEFSWLSNDCGRLAGFCMRKRGHKVRLPKVGAYKTALGARRALLKAGYDGLEHALDSHGLQRIAPAEDLPADIIAMPSDDEHWPALCVALSNGRVLGFSSSGFGAVLHPKAFVTAWRT
jgi:hypothetical protein